MPESVLGGRAWPVRENPVFFQRESSSLFMVTVVPQEERAQIDAVERRLAQKYTELPYDHVAAVVQHVHARFNQSTVRDYVPLLVERRAREELSKSTAAQAVVAKAGAVP
jgi:CRISPR/Cas system-associated exonuclease Cas4 (RecB family)